MYIELGSKINPSEAELIIDAAVDIAAKSNIRYRNFIFIQKGGAEGNSRILINATGDKSIAVVRDVITPVCLSLVEDIMKHRQAVAVK